MEPDSSLGALQIDIGDIDFIPNEQFCHLTLHSISPASESSSYKAFSILVSDPDPSSLVLTKNDILIEDSTTAQDDVSLAAYFPLELSHSERWVQVSIFDMNAHKLVLSTAIEISSLEQLHPYHLLASTALVSAKLSILKTPSLLYYHTFSGLEVALAPGIAISPTSIIHTSECVISMEVLSLKPPPSYKPNIKFAGYSRQHSKTQTFYLATPSVIPKLSRSTAHYAFLPDDCFKFRMESHYVVVALSRYDTNSPWYDRSPDILFYLELDPGTLSSLANKSLIKDTTDNVVYLKGNQSAHGFRTLVRMKRKDDAFMTLIPSHSTPSAIPPPPTDISVTEMKQIREELDEVRLQRDGLRRLNDEYEKKLDVNKPVQHLPSFSLNLLEQTSKPELIHKYVMLQQERDLLSRKLDKSKELVDNLYTSLEGYSELQERFSEAQESNFIQEIVRHLQERAARYKKLAKLCQNQEKTIYSYEEHFQKLLETQVGYSAIFTPPPPPVVEYESVKELAEMEGKSDRLLSRLEERLLQSSINQRSPTNRQNFERKRENELFMPLSGRDITPGLDSRNEFCYDDSNAETLANDLREIIQSIPKLDKLMF